MAVRPSLSCDPGQWAEFLDGESLVRDWRQDGWRQGPYAAAAVEVPVDLLIRLANPTRLNAIGCDQERLDKITAELARRGLDHPLILVIDVLGRLTLMDGHHRLLCARALGWDRLAVRVVRSQRIRTHAVPTSELLADLLQAVSNQVR